MHHQTPPAVLSGADLALKGGVTVGASATVASGGAKSNRVCRHFVRGRCTWGNACRFSHDPERADASSMDVLTPKSASPTGFVSAVSGGGGATAVGGVPTSPMLSTQTWIGSQQAQLQQQRHAILRAAMDGQFSVRPMVGSDGQTHHTIHLTTLPSPEIGIQLLTDHTLRMHLHQLESDERVREGGLHYLIGEPSAFWSMIRNWHQSGTTTSPKWDALLARARQTHQVDCMFYRSAAGCLTHNCPFEHSPKMPSSANAQHVLTMATSNALLQRVPSLGFGSSASAERLSDLSIGNNGSPLPSHNNVPFSATTAPSGGAALSSHHPNASAAAAMFQSTPTLDELAAASGGNDSWKPHHHHHHIPITTVTVGKPSPAPGSPVAPGSGLKDDEALSKTLWSMLSVAEPHPVPVTTAPSSAHCIW